MPWPTARIRRSVTASGVICEPINQRVVNFHWRATDPSIRSFCTPLRGDKSGFQLLLYQAGRPFRQWSKATATRRRGQDKLKLSTTPL